MTWPQIYALYVSPFVVLAAGFFVYWITGLEDKHRHVPGE